jgi:hypothetical protein
MQRAVTDYNRLQPSASGKIIIFRMQPVGEIPKCLSKPSSVFRSIIRRYTSCLVSTERSFVKQV